MPNVEGSPARSTSHCSRIDSVDEFSTMRSGENSGQAASALHLHRVSIESIPDNVVLDSVGRIPAWASIAACRGPSRSDHNGSGSVAAREHLNRVLCKILDMDGGDSEEQHHGDASIGGNYQLFTPDRPPFEHP